MSNLRITSVVKEDLLQGSQKYVKKGFLAFNRIVIDENKIELFKSGDAVAKIDIDYPITRGSTLTFELHKGKMELILESA